MFVIINNLKDQESSVKLDIVTLLAKNLNLVKF
jgi:hypothetical protein